MIEEALEHSPLGPSKADGWSICADYVNANAGLPDIPSFPAAEGSNAHIISDSCLSFGFTPADFIGATGKVHEWTFTWTEEDAELLQRGLSRWLSTPMHARFTEHRVNIEPWTIPGQFGTLDRAGFDDEWIYIEDLKWGRWPVYPVGHLQNVLYALGYWRDIAQHHTKATKFRLSIDQPRHAGGGGVWETDLGHLKRVGDWLMEQAEATQQPNPPRTASEKGCVWCRRKEVPGGCPTYEMFNTELIGAQFEDLDERFLAAIEPDEVMLAANLPVVITPERRSFILQHRKMIETWMDRLEDQELADYLAGLPTPGRKAVTDTQKGKRDAWISEAAAEAALVPLLGEASFTKKLITPTQAGKKVEGKAFATAVEPHILRGEKGKSMVPLADARTAIPVVLPEQFDDLDT